MEIGAGCVKASNKNSNVYCVQIWKIGTEHNKAALQLPHRAVTGDSRQKAADQHEAGQATGTATEEGVGKRSEVDGRLCQRPRQHPGNGNLMPRPEFEAGYELQHELRPRHSSLNLTCCLFYFQTRFNVVYIYTILVPIIHPPHPLQSPLQVQVALCELFSTSSSFSTT